MTIIGIGNDLVDIRRIEKLMNNQEERFIERCFTEPEKQHAEKRRAGGTHIATYAKRFAAKEACAKALGTGIAKGITFKDIGVINDEKGCPTLDLQGEALKLLNAILPDGTKPRIHLTMSDEPPLAQAFVIIEALPIKAG